MLVRRKDGADTTTLYAMKVLKKQELVKRNQILHTQTERAILQHVDHPFLMHIQFAFQTPDKLYMVLEFMGRGELFYWLKKDKRFSITRTRLYCAEILLGLQCLHSKDIIYRDLKPENILVDPQGHLRLTDFGLSKDNIWGAGIVGGTKTFCGTPEYLAPEILENKGHGKAVDWWSLGTLTYEMMGGLPPFYDQNMQAMYEKILRAPLRFHSHFPENAKEMLKGLLQRKVEQRLGSGRGDAEEIKVMAFFDGLDWDMVLSKGYDPEFQPPNAGLNFDKEFTDLKPEDSVVTTNLSTSEQTKANFEGFTYTEDAPVSRQDST